MKRSAVLAPYDGLLRLAALFIALALILLVPFLILGEASVRWWSAEALAGAGLPGVTGMWMLLILLLIVDLVLPVPNTAVIAAAGMLYGPILGGLVATIGLILSGVTGYLLCRRFGRPPAVWLIGEDGLQEGERLFARCGGWLVAGSRVLPVLPEVVACMAGLAQMPFPRFLLALACGAAPLGFAVAAAGAFGTERPLLTLALAALVPLFLWYGLRHRLGGER